MGWNDVMGAWRSLFLISIIWDTLSQILPLAKIVAPSAITNCKPHPFTECHWYLCKITLTQISAPHLSVLFWNLINLYSFTQIITALTHSQTSRMRDTVPQLGHCPKFFPNPKLVPHHSLEPLLDLLNYCITNPNHTYLQNLIYSNDIMGIWGHILRCPAFGTLSRIEPLPQISAQPLHNV